MSANPIVVGHAQPLYRAALRRLLVAQGFEVVAEAGDVADLLRKVGAHRPALVVIDDRCVAGAEIRRRFPRVAVFVISRRPDAAVARRLIAGNVAGIGYILEDRIDALRSFCDALRTVAGGGSVLDPEIVAMLLKGPETVLDPLTPRERDVVQLMVAGRSNLGIARGLFVSEHAVEKHLRNVFAKLAIPRGRGHHRRVLATLAVLQEG